jgi:hypothetical protein
MTEATTETAVAVPQYAGRIGVIIHSYDSVPFDTYFNHLYCATHWGRRFDLVWVGKSGLDAALARQALVERAIGERCSHALFLDEDHLLPKETLECLWESRECAIVSGLVCKKGEGFPQIAWEVHGAKRDEERYYMVTLPLDGSVYETTIPAFGCTLVNLEKLQKLEKPWFRDTCEAGADGVPINVRSDINLGLAFRRIGEKCRIDTRVLVGHMLTQYHSVVWPQSAEQMKQLKELEAGSPKLREGQRGFYYTPG